MPVFPGLSRSSYDIARLVDHQSLEDFSQPGSDHVICDIDKTYLETEFESLTGMARIAFEDATDKVTVAGAPEVLSLCRWGHVATEEKPALQPPPYLHFVSSSPPQLRAVLREKLVQDGLDWTSDTFKNQAYNLRMRRMDLLRQHIGYKSLAILKIVLNAGPGSRFWMIGDNAESDPFIYLGAKLLIEKRLDAAGYGRYLCAGGLEEKVSQAIVAMADKIPDLSVGRILVRRLQGYETITASPWTDSLLFFPDYFIAGLQLMADGLIAEASLPDFLRRFHNRYGLSVDSMVEQVAACELVDLADVNGPEWFLSALSRAKPVGQSKALCGVSEMPKADEGLFSAIEEWCQLLHKSKLKRRGKLEDIAD